ncbi:hypothetical protein IX83_02235 [Basilea psittacipulmonis DSM 24701]|uniref:Uncharacterized protein n=1 Tax=Basilea psittacipulmonis DSM 24701 TaxID=1072685 RepID=A0A077DBT6_9BURK|nr:hypothetical protein IX83_02235 [Basilea psittacipulmonis DSM 24701]
MNILLLGSHVTERAFAIDKTNLFNLTGCFVDTSIATIFHSSSIDNTHKEQLESFFQEKNTDLVLLEKFKECLSNKDFDYVVIDFIDNRFNIFEFNDKSKVLLSDERDIVSFIKRNEKNGKIIEKLSDEWFEEWKLGCIEFIKLVAKFNALDKIILNKIYWPSISSDKNTYDHNFVVKVNSFLDRQYNFFEDFLKKENIIRYHDEQFLIDSKYTSNVEPFCYTDELYLFFLTQLKDKKKDIDYINIDSKLDNIADLIKQQKYIFEKVQKDFISLQVNDYQETINKLTNELENNKKIIEKNKIELNKVNQQINQIKKQVENTISFQLGYTLIHSTKSFQNFISLPKNLFDIFLLAKKRKNKNNNSTLEKVSSNSYNFYPKIDSNFKKNNGFKFISILDEISYTSFESEFKLYPLNKKNFEDQIEGSTSLGFFIESCWKGNFGLWEYAFTSPNLQHQNAQNLLKAIDKCKKRDFPIVFWNKEDPMHYEKFLPIASKCNVIFTTDVNKVQDYQRDVPNAKVETLLFAANIHICNPANRFKIEQKNICFAGSYYGEGHKDRKKQMDALLPSIIKFKGTIYDRMSQLNNKRYAYPKKYHKFIHSSVPFKEIVNIYKKFKIFLNVNTITDSPTMMSRRVYELLACGTPVISTPSLAIDKQFKGIVQVAKNAKEANKIIKHLLENEWEWRKISHLGYREVMLKHTYEHRAMQIVNALGKNIQQEKPLVSIVMASNRPHFISRIVENITRQVYSNIEVIIITQNYDEEHLNELDIKLNNGPRKFSSVHIIRNDSDDTLGARLNQGIVLSKGEYVAKFDDDDFYFPNYLEDALIPFKFGDYGIVGKRETFVYLESTNSTILRYKNQCHMDSDFVSGATLILSKIALAKLKFADLNKGEDSNILEQAKKLNIKIYASDPYNYVQFRSKDVNNHTWRVEDEFFTKKGEFVGNGLAENITVL